MASPPPNPRPPYYRKVGATFQPRFTVSILYLLGFFFLYCLLLVAPALWEVLQGVPTGPEQQVAAEAAARGVGSTRLWLAMGLSGVTTILGAHYRVLPGLRYDG